MINIIMLWLVVILNPNQTTAADAVHYGSGYGKLRPRLQLTTPQGAVNYARGRG